MAVAPPCRGLRCCDHLHGPGPKMAHRHIGSQVFQRANLFEKQIADSIPEQDLDVTAVIGALRESYPGYDQLGIDPLQSRRDVAQLGANSFDRASVLAVPMCADDVNGCCAQIGAGLSFASRRAIATLPSGLGGSMCRSTERAFAGAGRISRA